jgi:hypothetical protein
MKRILLILPFVLAACDSGLTEPRTNLIPTAISLDAGGVRGHTFDDTFTKWITTFPNMAGVVGGDVGTGTYAGEILSYAVVGTITNIEALYHFSGREHSFTAHVYITEDDVAGTAVITGGVTEGWLKGSPVTGEYQIWATCPIPTPGNGLGTLCFQGALHILKGGVD